MLLPKSHSSQLRAVFFVLEKHKIAQASPSRCLMPDFAMVVAKTSMTLQRQVLKRPTVVLATLQKKGAFTHQKLWYIVVLWVEEKMQGSNVFFIPGIAGVLEMFPSTHSIRGKLKTIRMRSLPHRFQVSNFSILGTVVYTISKKREVSTKLEIYQTWGGFDTHFLMEVWFLGANSLNISSSFISLCISIDWCLRIQDCNCDWIPVDLHIYNISIYIIYT